MTLHTRRISRTTPPPPITDGGETTTKREKAEGKEKDPSSGVKRGTETSPAPGKAKATKANQKGKANPRDLTWAIALPNHAATVANLFIRTENVASVSMMKSRKRNLQQTTSLNTLHTFKLMRPP